MSGIIIEGMSIPNSCVECPLAMLNRYHERFCFVTESMANIDPFYGRPDDCPMKELEEES